MLERSLLLSACSVLLLCMGCGKDRDEQAPSVRIIDPGQSFSISVPDTLIVRVEVSDDRTVERVSFALTTSEGVPVSPTASIVVASPSATVARELPIISERLEGGSYTLAVTAFDGTNEGRAFRTINVSPAALRLRALYVTPPMAQSGGGPIWRIDSTGTVSSHLNVTEFGGGAIDVDRLFLAGTFTQPVRGIPQAAGISPITLPNDGPAGATVPFFNGLIVDPSDGRLYYGTNDGFVRGIDRSGIQAFTAQSPSGLRSRHTAVVGEVLTSACRHQSLGDWRLVTHARLSGAVMGQFPLDLVPVAMQARDGQHLLVFGNRNGVGVVQLRNVLQGGGADVLTFNDGPILAVARVAEGIAFLALPGRIIRYTTASNTVTVVAQGTNAQSLVYVSATGTLYAGEGGQLLAIDPLTGARSLVQDFPHDVGSILPLLNR
jgi:hypothetical protein